MIGIRFSIAAGECRVNTSSTSVQETSQHFGKWPSFVFTVGSYGRATVSLSQAQVLAAVEMLSRAL